MTEDVEPAAPFLGPAEIGHVVAVDSAVYGAGFTYRGQPLDPADVVVYLPGRAVMIPPGVPDDVVDTIHQWVENTVTPYREIRRG